MKKHTTKKAQVTIFIIIGLVILFLLALVYYLREGSIKLRPPVEQLEVSDDVKPIQQYVTQCLESVSKEALIKIGNNGGYAEIKNMKVSPISYNSDVLLFEPQMLPYWYYLDDACNNPQSPLGCLNTKRPWLCKAGVECVVESNGQNSIEEQVSKYVEEHINACLDDFSIFEEQFEIRQGIIKVDTRVKDDVVGFKLDYPLEITVRGSAKSIKIPYFYAEHNVKLKDMYMLSTDIYNSEFETQFLERQTLNLITAYSGVDQELLPPTSSMELFVAGKKYWVRSDVKESLMQDILPYMSIMQILNAGNADPIYATGTDEKYLQFADGFYQSMQVKVSNNSYFDIDANIIYPYSDIYLRIGDSEIIKPSSMDPGNNVALRIIGLFLNDYRFKYDLSYPVIIRLHDPEAFNGEGYTFTYAMEVNIRQNIPVTGNITVINAGGFRQIDLDSEIQQVNRTITIDAYDKHTGQPLPGVIIYYRCGNQYTMGETALEGTKATLSRKFPYCPVGGSIVYEKKGYMGSAIAFNNDEGIDAKHFKIELWPLQEKKIIVFKRTPTNLETIRRAGTSALALFSTQYNNISKNETVMISIARQKENTLDSDVPVVGFMIYRSQNSNPVVLDRDAQRQQIVELFNDGKITAADKDKMLFELDALPESTVTIQPTVEEYALDFVPGTYDIDSFMMYTGRIFIPREVRKFCPIPEILGICIPGEEEITLEAQDFDSWINGGAKTTLRLSENDVYSDRDTIVLYMLEIPIPTTWSMLESYPSPEQYQVGKDFLVRPRLI